MPRRRAHAGWTLDLTGGSRTRLCPPALLLLAPLRDSARPEVAPPCGHARHRMSPSGPAGRGLRAPVRMAGSEKGSATPFGAENAGRGPALVHGKYRRPPSLKTSGNFSGQKERLVRSRSTAIFYTHASVENKTHTGSFSRGQQQPLVQVSPWTSACVSRLHLARGSSAPVTSYHKLSGLKRCDFIVSRSWRPRV